MLRGSSIRGWSGESTKSACHAKQVLFYGSTSSPLCHAECVPMPSAAIEKIRVELESSGSSAAAAVTAPGNMALATI